TPRNPMGSLDGTVNPKTPEEYAEQVWIDSDAPYLNNSSIMVIRRISLNLDAWDRIDDERRNRVIGRDLHTGAPLSGGESEFDEEDMDAVGPDGKYLIDRHSHLALSREQDGLPNDALRRRAYSYDDPLESDFLTTNAGLVWIAFQKNPDKQFTAIQKRLDEADLLNHFIRHIGSAVYWIVPGTTPDSYWGEALFSA
ncbi:MAG: Dyp-type peroxidase, partial [Arcanobacterium sp.]|nr:Dyp-type peroxidase [Arcanobacterium sp.]